LTRISDVTIEAESKAFSNRTETDSYAYGIFAVQPNDTYAGTWTMTTLQVGSSGEDLTALVSGVDGLAITLNKTTGSGISADAYMDSTSAFRNAFQYANAAGANVLIPAGHYFVDSDVTIQTNVT